MDGFTFVEADAQLVADHLGGVHLSTSTGSIEADHAVICAGIGSPALVASAGGSLPLVPEKVGGPAFGYLAEATVLGHEVTGLVTTDHLGLRPNGAGSLLLQALDLGADAHPVKPTPEHVYEEFQKRVSAQFPGRNAEVTTVRVGHRVIPADGLTAVGPIHGSSAVYACVTHSGVVLAPWLASVLTDEVLGSEPSALLRDFRPDRFLTESALQPLPAPRQPGDQ